MISKLHGFFVFTFFGVIFSSVATGVVLSSKKVEPSFINDTPEFEIPEFDNSFGNDTYQETTDNVNVPIWWDEFDGDVLNRDYWSVMTGGNGWGNKEEQIYVDSSSNIELVDSKLVISAIKGADGVYTSGRIMTKGGWYPGMFLPNGKTTTKVRFEAVITLPEAGQGIWPAFWAIGTNYYGEFPGNGEIYIMELINDQKKLTQGIHFESSENHLMNMTRAVSLDGTFSLNTYKFTVDWNATSITFYMNEQITNTYYSRSVVSTGWFTNAVDAGENSPFDRQFNLVLNIAVGGSWPGSPDSTTPESVSMFVEYVRVYADFA